MIPSLLQVAIGGAIGASARYLVNVGAMRLLGPGFPWGTVAVNVAGSFLMGVLVVALATRGGQGVAPLLMTGMLGGFTTFSAFSLDAITLYERGAVALAGAYVVGSVVAALLSFMAGLAVTRMVMT